MIFDILNHIIMFLCFMKPIINGKGNYYVEPETRDNTRMDVVISYGGCEYIVANIIFEIATDLSFSARIPNIKPMLIAAFVLAKGIFSPLKRTIIIAWNIAADFNVDMSFSAEEIAKMLNEYSIDTGNFIH